MTEPVKIQLIIGEEKLSLTLNSETTFNIQNALEAQKKLLSGVHVSVMKQLDTITSFLNTTKIQWL